MKNFMNSNILRYILFIPVVLIAYPFVVSVIISLSTHIITTGKDGHISRFYGLGTLIASPFIGMMLTIGAVNRKFIKKEKIMW